ncbi:MAG: serine/threonine-protein kinase [Byssovorax sp.]
MTAPQLAPGTVVARKYSLASLLGFGGSSSTYLAKSSDGREVTVKFFDPAIRQRTDIMALIEQTYAGTNALPADIAVPLLDAGYDDATGAPFSVSERIPFPSLAQLVAQRALTPEETATVVTFLARALDAAHQRGLFHHAIKPTNIFVGFQQGYGVRLTDFGAGLCRLAVPTQEGYALAAPWMAPEQVQGQTPAGAAADVFALALCTFFALTGRSYWRSCQGNFDSAGWQRELMAPRTPPSARALQLGVTLNSAFDSVLGAALSLDPAGRYRSVGEFAMALDAIVAVKGPETAHTMAFPAMGLGDYPPPPPPTGGLGTPPPAAGMPPNPAAPQPPVQAQQPQLAPGQGQPSGAYISTQSQAGGDNTEIGRRPTELPAPRKAASSNKLVPIVLGVIVVVLLGGSIAAVVLMGKKPDSTSTAGSGAPSAGAPITASAEPQASAIPSAVPSAEPTAAVATIEVTLKCDPGCDELKVDDTAVEPGKPTALAPGKHTVVASKADFKTVTETIDVSASTKEKTFKLTAEKKAATSTPNTPTTTPTKQPSLPPCTRFIKTNCKK